MPPRKRARPAAVLPLPEFEGVPVTGQSFALVKVNDVIRDAVPPDATMVGSEVFLLLRGRVTAVEHGEPSPESDVRVRRHHIVAQMGAFVSEVDAKLLLDAEHEQRDARASGSSDEATKARADEEPEEEPSPE